MTEPAANNRIYIARITAVEVVSAITRRRRGGSLSLSDASTAITLFRHDLVNEYRIIEVTPTLIDVAMSLAETHGLRAYDATQLAAALEINHQRLAWRLSSVTMVCADVRLNVAASTEGLTVDNPNNYP